MPDVLIVGAGIFGLWAARHAIMAGKRVLVLDRGRAGDGASGGFLGALMPHMPDRWNAKKQFQFEALTSLPDAVAALEADTGLACGYRRCGRLIPVLHRDTMGIVERRSGGAREYWAGRFRLEHVTPAPGNAGAGWPDARQAPFGMQFDDLSARVDPRAYLASLRAFVAAKGELREGVEAVRLEPGRAVLADGSAIEAGEIVVAAGWRAYELLQPFMSEMAIEAGGAIGRGVKGQAVLVHHTHGDDLPILYADGTYVVPHAGNRVAIGSTARDEWDHAAPEAFDPGDMGFYERALELVPALRDAPILERWANVRPRNMLAQTRHEPFMGPVPGHEWLSARIGGFRIGMAVGHMESDATPLARPRVSHLK
ncbi:MAG: FAD-binding oxidoreductase [Nitratireductor sp.]|nr:FAD-binding oxidoreductase [Nitratireductor sp.]